MTGGFTVKGRDRTGAVVFEMAAFNYGFSDEQLVDYARAAGLDPSALVWSL